MSGATGTSVFPGKRITRKKENMKSLAMLPPRKDPIPNQDINILGTKKYQSLPLQLSRYFPGYKSLINEAEDGRNDSTDTSRTDKEDSVKNLKAINKKIIDDEYKDGNSPYHKSNGSVIKKPKKKNHLLNG